MNVHSLWLTKSPPFLLGHRGFPGRARENTLPSFEAALEAGAQGVELDVHVTRDGAPVVHHDPTAWNGDREVLLADLTLEAATGSEFQAEGGAYRIPTLREILGGLPRDTLVNVEIKPPRAKDVDHAVTSILPEIQNANQVLVSSFDLGVLRALYREDPDILLGFLVSDLTALADWAGTPPLFAIHPHWKHISPNLVSRAQSHRQRVYAWTVDDAGQAETLLSRGVHGIITNRPDLLKNTWPGG